MYLFLESLHVWRKGPGITSRGQQIPDTEIAGLLPQSQVSTGSCNVFYVSVCVYGRFEQFNRKYLRRFLIREDHQARSSILRVYQELERREQRGDEEAPPL